MAEFSFTYRAFISYAHADRKWAVWLHRALERYRVPKRIVGEEGPRRIGKCFRDEEELGAASELGPKIEKALQTSDVLIVVCSPRSAKSQWVNQEIAAFKKLGREHRVFALIVDGAPHGGADAEGNATECFPPTLKTTAAGGVAEPLAVDVRKFGRGDAVLRVISGLLDVDYDSLREREVRRRRAERRAVGALFVSALVLIAAALTGGYFAAVNYVEAGEMKSNLFAREANTLNNEGHHAKAMLMALHGNPAAQDTLAERVLRPEGYTNARNAVVGGYTHNRLERTIRIGAAEYGDGRPLAVAFSPDSKTFLIGSDVGIARLWSVADGKLLATLEGHTATLNAVAFSPDGKYVTTASADGAAKLWPASGGAEIATIVKGERQIFAAAFSSDSTRVLTESSRGDVEIWSVPDGKEIAKFSYPGLLHSESSPLAVFLGSDYVAMASTSDTSIYVWSISEGKLVRTLEARSGSVTALAGSNLMLTAAGSGMTELWRDSGMSAGRLNVGEPVRSVALSSDESTALAVTDRAATLWFASQLDNRKLAPLAIDDGGVLSGALSPDGKRVLIASRLGTVRLWSVSGAEALQVFDAAGSYNSAAAFAPDGNTVLTGNDESAKLWPISGGEALQTFGGPKGHQRSVRDVAFSPDGGTILTGSTDQTAKLWRTSGGDPIATFTGHTEELSSVAFSPDGKSIVTGSYDGTAKLWTVAGGELKTMPGRDERTVNDVAFSPDGKTVLIGSGGGAELWSVEGKRLASYDGHAAAVGAAAFSPDGKSVLTGSYDETAKLWPVAGGEASISYVGHEGGVHSVAFSLDGKFVVTASEDGTAKVWPVRGGAPLMTLGGYKGEVFSVAFSPDSKMLLSASGATPFSDFSNGTAGLWAMPDILFAPAGKQVRDACAKLLEIGVVEFSEEDYARFPILDRKAPHPCAKVWGVDPRVKQEVAAAK